MTDQYTATEVVEFADRMRKRGLDVPEFDKCVYTLDNYREVLTDESAIRCPNSVANELIGVGLVGLAVNADYYLRPVSNGRWIVREVFDPDLREWKGDSPLAAVVAACVTVLPLLKERND